MDCDVGPCVWWYKSQIDLVGIQNYIYTYVEHVEHQAWVVSILIDYYVYRLGDILGLHQAYNKSIIHLSFGAMCLLYGTKSTSWSCPKLYSTTLL